MKHKKNILMIIIALVLVLALAACGQKTNGAVNDDNIEKSDESMEILPSLDEDNDNDESTEHKDSDDDFDDDSIKIPRIVITKMMIQ